MALGVLPPPSRSKVIIPRGIMVVSTVAAPRGCSIVVTGNPVRLEIAQVREALRLLGAARSGWRVVHQTGPRQVESVRRACAALPVNAEVAAFFDDLPSRYQAASRVVSRAGATTLAELACCGRPMILLPDPHAADDHQRANARAFESLGAALCVEHRTAPQETATALAEALGDLIADAPHRQAMAQAVQAASHPNATCQITDQIQQRTRHARR